MAAAPDDGLLLLAVEDAAFDDAAAVLDAAAAAADDDDGVLLIWEKPPGGRGASLPSLSEEGKGVPAAGAGWERVVQLCTTLLGEVVSAFSFCLSAPSLLIPRSTLLCPGPSFIRGGGRVGEEQQGTGKDGHTDGATSTGWRQTIWSSKVGREHPHEQGTAQCSCMRTGACSHPAPLPLVVSGFSDARLEWTGTAAKSSGERRVATCRHVYSREAHCIAEEVSSQSHPPGIDDNNTTTAMRTALPRARLYTSPQAAPARNQAGPTNVIPR